jgi:hypothetical protein
LEQAKKSVKLTHLLIKDMYSLCDYYVEKDHLEKGEHSGCVGVGEISAVLDYGNGADGS